MTKIAASSSRSGSISQRHVSADPDPYQNVTDPRHCLLVKIKCTLLSLNRDISIVSCFVTGLLILCSHWLYVQVMYCSTEPVIYSYWSTVTNHNVTEKLIHVVFQVVNMYPPQNKHALVSCTNLQSQILHSYWSKARPCT
jgi:hypothetical protein